MDRNVGRVWAYCGWQESTEITDLRLVVMSSLILFLMYIKGAFSIELMTSASSSSSNGLCLK